VRWPVVATLHRSGPQKALLERLSGATQGG
jgi:hypothetical protein